MLAATPRTAGMTRWNLDGGKFLCFALPLAAFLLCLGSAPLFDVDEGAFSEATREMFERGDFLSTWLNGQPRFDKPILIYWLQAASYWMFGGLLGPEWAFRLPSALAATAWCYAIWHFARPRFGPDTALAALAVAATSIGPFAIGRAATADALLNLLLVLSLFDAWRHLESARTAPLLRCYAWIGLGALTKGPIALLIPGAVTLLYCASRKHWKIWLRAMSNPTGWLIFALLAAPWYATALAIHGQAFIDGFILKHNVQRFTGTLEGHAGSLFYYALFIPLLLMPWTGPLFASLRKIKADCVSQNGHPTSSGLRRFLWVWAGFVVAFFSLSGTKLPHYALYGATPLFLLIAAHRDGLKRAAAHLALPTALLALFAALPFLCAVLSSQQLGNAYYRELFSEAALRAGPGYYAICGGALLIWLVLLFTPWQRKSPWHRLLFAACLQTVVLALAVTPWLGAMLQGPMKETALFTRGRPENVVLWRVSKKTNIADSPSVSVYRNAVTPTRPPEDGEIAITWFENVPEQGFVILFKRAGVVAALKTAPPAHQ
ncbi:MAG: glycosyltransferase family 39 protein [Azoarcus sp.]|jgi:4-amino-4-deoxy-L-arabinose transferase-like glycosyltransferase|nr:glycosyltransferase family 39 protein [Azoarcus sp.]